MKKELPKVNIFTFQVTNQCQLRCKYCYTDDKAKLPPSIPWEIACRAVDYFVTDRDRFSAEMVSLDFIGGEPLLYINLIDEIIEYFKKKCSQLKHYWLDHFAISITTNGILYGNEKVQEFIAKYQDHLNINITLDGDRKKHDSNRVYPDGTGSYDDVITNISTWTKQFPGAASKVTLTRKDLPDVFDSVVNLWNLGIHNINIGFAVEDDWQPSDAFVIEKQLYRLADYIKSEDINDGRRLPFFPSPLNEKLIHTQGGNGVCKAGEIITVGMDGNLYPCARFAPGTQGSLPIRKIGDCDKGINEDLLRPYRTYDRRLYSPEKCLDCDVENSCSWCHAANYSKAQTPTICQPLLGLCEIHKVIAKVNRYFWRDRTQEDEQYE